MKPLEIAGICCAVAFFIGIVIYIVCKVVFKKKVKEHSKIYNALLALNKAYKFHPLQSLLKYTHACNTKRQFDTYNLEKAFTGIVANGLDYFKRLLAKVEENKQLLKKYKADCSKILEEKRITKEETRKFKVPFKSWIEIEEKLYTQNKLNPVTKFSVLVRATYTSPQGRNSYSQEWTYQQNDVAHEIKTIEYEMQQAAEKALIEQKRREERERLKALRPANQIERNKLSKKLRYEILERDNYRCVLCGRSADDGVILHIDHIIPISKGGKTVPENLRTLCSDCNLGKRDKLPKIN